jgi:hypothetical protein
MQILTGAKFTNVSIYDCDFSNSDLLTAEFISNSESFCSLTKCKFVGSDLTNSKFSGKEGIIVNCDFSNSNLEKAKFEYENVYNNTFSDSYLGEIGKYEDLMKLQNNEEITTAVEEKFGNKLSSNFIKDYSEDFTVNSLAALQLNKESELKEKSNNVLTFEFGPGFSNNSSDFYGRSAFTPSASLTYKSNKFDYSYGFKANIYNENTNNEIESGFNKKTEHSFVVSYKLPKIDGLKINLGASTSNLSGLKYNIENQYLSANYSVFDNYTISNELIDVSYDPNDLGPYFAVGTNSNSFIFDGYNYASNATITNPFGEEFDALYVYDHPLNGSSKTPPSLSVPEQEEKSDLINFANLGFKIDNIKTYNLDFGFEYKPNKFYVGFNAKIPVKTEINIHYNTNSGNINNTTKYYGQINYGAGVD